MVSCHKNEARSWETGIPEPAKLVNYVRSHTSINHSNDRNTNVYPSKKLLFTPLNFTIFKLVQSSLMRMMSWKHTLPKAKNPC